MYQYGFCDLCINVDGVDSKYVSSVCKRLQTYGFKTVALNTTIDEEVFKTTKKKKGKQKDDSAKSFLPEPIIPNLEAVSGLTVLSRLTAHISDQSQLFQLRRSPNFQKYNLFAAIPKNQSTFQQLCGSSDVDIISLIAESRLPYRISRKLYDLAVSKKIFFELPYGPTIMDSTCRKNIISTAHQYFTLGKAKNIILTSSTSYPYYSIRGPYDIVHLGLIYGLNDVLSKQAISKNCTELINKAEARRKNKSCFSSLKLSSPAKHKIPSSNLSAAVRNPMKKIRLNDSMETGD